MATGVREHLAVLHRKAKEKYQAAAEAQDRGAEQNREAEKHSRSIALVHRQQHMHTGMPESPDSQLAAAHEGLADFFHDRSQEHAAAARAARLQMAYHAEALEACTKTLGDDGDLRKAMIDDPAVQQMIAKAVAAKVADLLGDKLVPTQVSGIAPTPPGIRAVPRAGGPSIQSEIPNVPIEFQKLLSIEE